MAGTSHGVKNKAKSSSVSRSRIAKTESSGCSSANSLRIASGSTRTSSYENSKSRSKMRKRIKPGPCDGGLAAATTSPLSRVMLSMKPLSRTCVPAGELKKARTGKRSEKILFSKSRASSTETMYSLISKELGNAHALLFAMAVGFQNFMLPEVTPQSTKHDR